MSRHCLQHQEFNDAAPTWLSESQGWWVELVNNRCQILTAWKEELKTF